MRLNMHITRKDYSDAMFLPLKEHAPWLRRIHYINKIARIAAVLVAVYFLIENLYRLIFHGGRSSIVLVLILSVALFTYVAFLRMRAITFDTYRASNYRFTSECEVNEDYILYRNVLGEVKFPWNSFSKWMENQHLFILYPAKDQLCFSKWKENKDQITLIPAANDFDIFSKHCFSSEHEINDFRRILIEKIGKGTMLTLSK